ncbi:hypothetical protein [Parabacteroides sp. Marseille-P3160]|uniref:hypothetical protein n=1 Tax=Parabacteroides sp. Marseille-P3160 TaxID=1917887 RepID=UPI0009BA9B9D|nr:hypothetical protein [Parabacteroides sp. Marseille-P3160]
MPKLHFFNPGHETAILDGSPNYTPTQTVRSMTHELALLPAWYADSEDYIFMEEKASPLFLSSLTKTWGMTFPKPVYKENLLRGQNPFPTPVQAMPWGISPQSVSLFERLNHESILPPLWKEEYRTLTGRQTAADCLDKIKEILPLAQEISTPRFSSTEQEVEEYLRLHRPPFLLKTPYSSSGRGLLWIENQTLNEKERIWLRGAFRKQGSVSIEPVLKKRNDFAMEFYSDGKGNVSYEGLSLMGNNSKGKFQNCALGTEAEMESALLFNTAFTPLDLQKTREAVMAVMRSALASVYEGYFGVDMLLYVNEDGIMRIHPLVEINLRYTMGLVALQISRKHLKEKRGIGNFSIEYFSHRGDALYNHKIRGKAYPLEMEGNRIVSGYLSLCPVRQDTHYLASIVLM